MIVDEVEARKNILCGSCSGFSNKRKTSEWLQVITVNHVSATQRLVLEVYKKTKEWLDMKVEAKRKPTCHSQSVSSTGGDQGKPSLHHWIHKSILGPVSVGGYWQRRRET